MASFVIFWRQKLSHISVPFVLIIIIFFYLLLKTSCTFDDVTVLENFMEKKTRSFTVATGSNDDSPSQSYAHTSFRSDLLPIFNTCVLASCSYMKSNSASQMHTRKKKKAKNQTQMYRPASNDSKWNMCFRNAAIFACHLLVDEVDSLFSHML